MYSGTYVTGKRRQFKVKQYTTEAEDWKVIENHHEPVVTKKDYEVVQAILEKNNHKNTYGEENPSYGLFYCTCCRLSLRYEEANARKGLNTAEYCCYTHRKNTTKISR